MNELPSSAAVTSQRQLRVGLVGAGYWGPNLARNIAELPNADLVAVADVRAERLEQVRLRHPGAQTTTEVEDLFDTDIDAVVIATPPQTHHMLGRAFLERGFHCLVEKPVATSVAEATELVELARANDVCLMVGHTFEYNPAVREVRRMIDDGELGHVFYIDSIRANLGLFQLNTNAMWDLAPHDISIANYLFGDAPESVSAHGGSFLMRQVGVEDLMYLHLKYPGGRLANIHVSWLHPNKTRRTTVVGDTKMIVYDDVSTVEKIRVYDKGVEELPYADTYGEFQCSYRYGDITVPHLHWEEPLKIECRDFVESILGGRPPLVDGSSGLHVVEVLEAANRSLELGRMVAIDEVREGTRPTRARPRPRPGMPAGQQARG